jgi:hypothetical protein
MIYFRGILVKLAKICTIGLAIIKEGYYIIRELVFRTALPVFDLSEVIDSIA